MEKYRSYGMRFWRWEAKEAGKGSWPMEGFVVSGFGSAEIHCPVCTCMGAGSRAATGTRADMLTAGTQWSLACYAREVPGRQGCNGTRHQF
jgi:hypothetical protein